MQCPILLVPLMVLFQVPSGLLFLETSSGFNSFGWFSLQHFLACMTIAMACVLLFGWSIAVCTRSACFCFSSSDSLSGGFSLLFE
jgi:hypothetical protein